MYRRQSPMTLKSDAKFKEKLTCGFKYDKRNLVNFYPTTQKFLSKVYQVWAKKIQRSYLWWHLTVTQNLNKPWPCGFKNDMRNWVNFHYSTQKSEKLYIDGLFLSKGYNVSARKFQRDYVSWHWRVMQNLKENWLVAWKITSGICLIFMRAVESLEICTLMGFFCPKHIKI